MRFEPLTKCLMKLKFQIVNTVRQKWHRKLKNICRIQRCLKYVGEANLQKYIKTRQNLTKIGTLELQNTKYREDKMVQEVKDAKEKLQNIEGKMV